VIFGIVVALGGVIAYTDFKRRAALGSSTTVHKVEYSPLSTKDCEEGKEAMDV